MISHLLVLTNSTYIYNNQIRWFMASAALIRSILNQSMLRRFFSFSTFEGFDFSRFFIYWIRPFWVFWSSFLILEHKLTKSSKERSSKQTISSACLTSSTKTTSSSIISTSSSIFLLTLLQNWFVSLCCFCRVDSFVEEFFVILYTGISWLVTPTTSIFCFYFNIFSVSVGRYPKKLLRGYLMKVNI